MTSNIFIIEFLKGRGELLLSRYLQRWSKDYLRRRLDWTVDEEGGNPPDPRHLTSALCPCQYIEEHLRNKPRRDPRAFCPAFSAFLRERGIDWVMPYLLIYTVIIPTKYFQVIELRDWFILQSTNISLPLLALILISYSAITL